jgi:hypothetical protein
MNIIVFYYYFFLQDLLLICYFMCYLLTLELFIVHKRKRFMNIIAFYYYFFLQDLLLICYFMCYLLTLYQLFASLHFVPLQYFFMLFCFIFLCVSLHISFSCRFMCQGWQRFVMYWFEFESLFWKGGCCMCHALAQYILSLSLHHTIHILTTLLVTLSVSWDQEPPTAW